MNKYIIQWDFGRYMPTNPNHQIEQNKLWKDFAVKADNGMTALKAFTKDKNLNPFYLIAIPINQFDGIIKNQFHQYSNLQY